MRLRELTSEVWVADEPLVQVSPQEIALLKERIPLTPRGRIRLCAHGGDQDALHEMFLALARDTYIRPHKHPGKCESLHVIEGVADLVIFDEDGNVRQVVPLGDPRSGRPFYYRLSQPWFHTLLIHSDVLVVHETTNGPFRAGETVLAPWAPAEGEPAVSGFRSKLAEDVDRAAAGATQPRTPSPTSHVPHSIIVGGTRGIGREVAEFFRVQGHRVSVLGRHAPDRPEDRREGISHWTVDLADRSSLATMLDRLVADQGRWNSLVFLQRFTGDGEPRDGEPRDGEPRDGEPRDGEPRDGEPRDGEPRDGEPWDGELETSLTATRFVIDRLADQFSERGDRSIVIVSSIADQFVSDSQPVGYHVAKSGLHQMTRYYAVQLGQRGIRVNCVSPSTVIKEENRAWYARNASLTELFNAAIPLGRMATARDVAQVIWFLCSPLAGFVTGQRIAVDGGVSLLAQEALARRLTGL
jgi:cupin fold WbuC family metalloprotein